MSGTSRLGIDLGGTKIEAWLLSPDGVPCWRQRVATPAGSYRETLQAIAMLVREARQEARRFGRDAPTVGLGTPGAVSPHTGRIKNANSTCLNGHVLVEDLESLLGCAVRVSNDANCMLVSEVADGAARGASSAFGVILGTGVGGALWTGGQLIEGHHRIGGEWGHNPLPWPRADEMPGPSCYCGRCGCNETWLSGPALLADHARHGGAASSAAEVVEMADQGDARAQATLARHADRLARGLASIINVFDPDVIVLAGGLSNIESLYTEVPRLWGQYVFSDHVETALRRNLHGDASGVRGAAWLWPASPSG